MARVMTHFRRTFPSIFNHREKKESCSFRGIQQEEKITRQECASKAADAESSLLALSSECEYSEITHSASAEAFTQTDEIRTTYTSSQSEPGTCNVESIREPKDLTEESLQHKVKFYTGLKLF